MDVCFIVFEDGQILIIYFKCGELVGVGIFIMSLVVLDDCYVVFNVCEDYMFYFCMNENFMGDILVFDVKNKVFKINYISLLGSFVIWCFIKQMGIYDMKIFEIYVLFVELMEGLRLGMFVLVNLDELK